LGPIPGLGIEGAIERVGPVCRYLVGIRNAENVPGKRDIPGEAWLAQREMGLKGPLHLSLSKTLRQHVILDDDESEAVSITEIEGASLRVREPSGRGQNPLRQQSEVALARQSDPDLDQLAEQKRAVEG